jgi:hypothetical protein
MRLQYEGKRRDLSLSLSLIFINHLVSDPVVRVWDQRV